MWVTCYFTYSLSKATFNLAKINYQKTFAKADNNFDNKYAFLPSGITIVTKGALKICVRGHPLGV